VFDIFHEGFWRAGLGDWIDPYFINYLLEHWYRSVATLGDPSSPPMYFPVQKTLGYSHGLILYAPFYILVRLFLHPFQAYSLSLLIVIETGIVCLYLFFRRSLKLSFLESLLLTAFFFTSQNVINGTVGVWSQRASVFLIPPILLLLVTAIRRPDSRLHLGVVCLAGALTTLLFVHDFYTAQFAMFFALLFAVAAVAIDYRAAVVRGISGFWKAQSVIGKAAFVIAVAGSAWALYVLKYGGLRARVLGITIASRDWRRGALLAGTSMMVFVALRGWRRIKSDLAVVAPWVWAFSAGLATGASVFLWIFLPAYLEHPRFPEKDLLSQLAVRDPSRWTGLAAALRDLGAYGTLRSFKIVFIVSVLACLPWLRADRKTRLYVLWAAAISLVVFVIPLEIRGFSIWLAFFRHIPGFNVIRDPTRIIYLYELAFILAVALLLAGVRSRPGYRIGVCGLLLFFMVTDHHTDVFDYERPVNVYRRWVDWPIDIPPACQSFFISRASDEYIARSPHMWALYNIDAMFFSLNHAIPTLNGYSAWAPEGWNLMNPQEADYDERVQAWIQKNELHNVCELDVVAHTLRPLPPL